MKTAEDYWFKFATETGRDGKMIITEANFKQAIRECQNEAQTEQSHIHNVVRGGDKVRESVQRVQEYLDWLKGDDTLNTPTEPLPAEGVAQNGSDGFWCRYIRNKRCECEANGECNLL